MNPELEEMIKAAREAGYSEEEIQAVVDAQSQDSSTQPQETSYIQPQPQEDPELESIIEAGREAGYSDEEIEAVRQNYSSDAGTQTQTQVPDDGVLRDSEGEKSNLPEGWQWIEDTVVGDFFQDIWNSAEAGFLDGRQISATDELAVGSYTEEELERYINAVNASRNSEESKEMKEFMQEKEECGGGAWCTLKAIAKRPSVATQIMTRSAISMFSNLEGLTVAGGTAAAAGAASGGVLALPAGFGALSAYTDGMMSFTEFLEEELNGKEFNEKNVAAILQDPDKMARIRGRAAARGIAIGTIDALTMGVSAGLTRTARAAKKLGKSKRITRGIGAKVQTATGSKALGGLAVAGTEAVGGSIGEFAGQVAAGQDIDTGEILLEGIAELGGPGTVIGTARGIKQVREDVIKGRTGKVEGYKLNGQNLTEQEFKEGLSVMDDSQLASADIEISNDSKFAEQVDKQQKLANARNSIRQNPTLSESQVEEMAPLQVELDEINAADNNTEAAKDLKKNLVEQIKLIMHPELAVDNDSKTETKAPETKKSKTPKKPKADAVQQVQKQEAESDVPLNERVETEAEAESQAQEEIDDTPIENPITEPVETEISGEKIKVDPVVADKNMGETTIGKARARLQNIDKKLTKIIDQPSNFDGVAGMNTVFAKLGESGTNLLLKAIRAAIRRGDSILAGIEDFVNANKKDEKIKPSRLIGHVTDYLNSDEFAKSKAGDKAEGIPIVKGKKAKPRNKAQAEAQAKEEAEIRSSIEERFNKQGELVRERDIARLERKLDKANSDNEKASLQRQIEELKSKPIEKVDLSEYTQDQIKTANILRAAGLNEMPNSLKDRLDSMVNPDAYGKRLDRKRKETVEKLFKRDEDMLKKKIRATKGLITKESKKSNPDAKELTRLKRQLRNLEGTEVKRVNLDKYGPSTLAAIGAYINSPLNAEAIVNAAANAFSVDTETRNETTKKYTDVLDEYVTSGSKGGGVVKFFKSTTGATLLNAAMGPMTRMDSKSNTTNVLSQMIHSIEFDETVTDEDIRNEFEGKKIIEAQGKPKKGEAQETKYVDLSLDEMKKILKVRLAQNVLVKLEQSGLINPRKKKNGVNIIEILNPVEFATINVSTKKLKGENKSKAPLTEQPSYYDNKGDNAYIANGRKAIINISNAKAAQTAPENAGAIDAIDNAQSMEVHITKNGWLQFVENMISQNVGELTFKSLNDKIESYEKQLEVEKDEKRIKRLKSKISQVRNQKAQDTAKRDRQVGAANDFSSLTNFFLQKVRGKNGRFYTTSDDVTFQADKLALTFLDIPKVPVTPEIIDELIYEAAVLSGINTPDKESLMQYGKTNLEKWLSYIDNPKATEGQWSKTKEPLIFMRIMHELHGIVNGNIKETGVLMEIDDRSSGIQMYSGAIGDASSMTIANLLDPSKVYDSYETVANNSINSDSKFGTELDNYSTKESLDFINKPISLQVYGKEVKYDNIQDLLDSADEEKSAFYENYDEAQRKAYFELKNMPKKEMTDAQAKELEELNSKIRPAREAVKKFREKNRKAIASVNKAVFNDKSVSVFIRDVFKKAISTIPYGASVNTNNEDVNAAFDKYSTKAIAAKLDEQSNLEPDSPEFKRLNDEIAVLEGVNNPIFANILGSNVHASFKNTFKKEFKLMEVLKKAVEDAYAEERALEFPLPDGFLFINETRKPKIVKVTSGTTRGGGKLNNDIAVGDGELDLAGMRKQIAPNFAHMLDAQLASYVYTEAAKQGKTVLINHDGFMTTPDNIEWLKKTLLEGKEKIFAQDIVGDFFRHNFPIEQANKYITEVFGTTEYTRTPLLAKNAINSAGTGRGTSLSPDIKEVEKAYKENQSEIDEFYNDMQQQAAEKMQCKI